jgi:hypothetical protein
MRSLPALRNQARLPSRRGALASLVLSFALLFAARTASAEGAPPPPKCPPNCDEFHFVEPKRQAQVRWRPGFAMRAISVRGSFERTGLAGEHQTNFSGGLEERGLAHMNFGVLSARYLDFATIGGGNAGVDGGLGADVAFGLRPRLGRGHGPLFRLNARAHLLYGGRFHSSLVEFPAAQVGYAFVGGTYHVELAGRAGLALVGRYAVEGATSRHLGGAPELGGYLSLGARPLRLELDVSRIASETDRFGGLHAVDGFMCVVFMIPTVCAHAQVLQGDAAVKGERRETTASYAGITVGLSAFEWR